MPKKELNNNTKLSFRTILLRGILYVIIIPTAVMFLLVGGFYLKADIEANQAQATMKTYLQNKYNEEFIVEKPERKSSGLGVEGVLAANAYPIRDPHIRFSVNTSSNGNQDNYPGVIWSRSQNDKLIKDHIINNSWAQTDITVSLTDNTAQSLSGTPKTYEEAIVSYGKDIHYIISVNRNTNQLAVDNRDRYYLMSLIRYINQQKVGYRIIHYGIHDTKMDTDIVCNIQLEGTRLLDEKQANECFRE